MTGRPALRARAPRARPAVAALAAGALLLAAVACGGGGGGRDPETLRIGEFPWSAAALTTAILERVVARHPELGVARVERVPVDPERGWSLLADGDLDVLAEVYLPNQPEYLGRVGGAADVVSRTYSGAANAWYVPGYAVRPGGPAEGLTAVDELRRFAGVFGGRLHDGEQGWVTTRQNADRIEGFRLPLEQVTSSEAELVRALERSYAARRPILLYLWRPHAAHARFDLVALEEPNPYSVDCFEGERKACAMPTNDVWLAARTDVASRRPRLQRMLTRFSIPLEEMERMLLEVDEGGRSVDAVAGGWLQRHEAELERWIGRR